MAETLEFAQERSLKFLAFVLEEVRALGIDPVEEPMFEVARKAIPVLTEHTEHYELREQLAGSFSSVAYKYVTRKWKRSGEAIV